MLLSPGKNGLTSLFKGVTGFSRFVPGTHWASTVRNKKTKWVCPRAKLSLSLGQTRGRPRANPKGPNLEKIQDRLKFSISLENFNLA